MSEPILGKANQRPVRWTLWTLASLLPLLFLILVWQLATIDPAAACAIVKSEGTPPGDHCFKLWVQGYHIKGWTIWGLLALMAVFVLVALVAAVKAVVSVVGPGGLTLNINGDPDA